jgi:DNA-binding GntR family transcriptional regulator
MEATKKKNRIRPLAVATPTQAEPQQDLTQAQRVYDELRRRIFSGRWDPSTRMSMRALSRELGCSVVPVSEAIRRFEQQGILETRNRSGIRLRQPSPEEAREMRILRKAVELHAVERIFQRGGAEETLLKKLRAVAIELYDALEQGRNDEATWLDYEFHHVLVAASGSKKLVETFENVSLCLAYSDEWGTWDRWRQREKNPRTGHVQFVETLQTGPAELARTCLNQHF